MQFKHPKHHPDKFSLIACEPCQPGSFAPNTGQTSCTLCPLGQFNNATNKTSCTNCPIGSYTSRLGTY